MSDLVIFKDGGQDLMILQAYLFLGGERAPVSRRSLKRSPKLV